MKVLKLLVALLSLAVYANAFALTGEPVTGAEIYIEWEIEDETVSVNNNVTNNLGEVTGVYPMNMKNLSISMTFGKKYIKDVRARLKNAQVVSGVISCSIEKRFDGFIFPEETFKVDMFKSVIPKIVTKPIRNINDYRVNSNLRPLITDSYEKVYKFKIIAKCSLPPLAAPLQ